MIESLNLDIQLLIWSIMIGLLWILLEQAYQYARVDPGEMQVERETGFQTKNTTNQVKVVVPTQRKLLPATSDKTSFFHGRTLPKVNPDVHYLSGEVLSYAMTKVAHKRSSNFKKAQIKVQVQDKFNTAMQVIPLEKHLKVKSNIYNLTDCGANFLERSEYNGSNELACGYHGLHFEPRELELSEIFNLVKNIPSLFEFNLIKTQRLGDCISMAPYKTVLNINLKNSQIEITLSAHQFKSFIVAAYLIMRELNDRRYQKLSCVENIFPCESKARLERKPAGVIITELKAEEVGRPIITIDIDMIIEGARLKNCTKRRRKYKRQERPIISSTIQCLGRLAYYMSTRKKYSSTDLTMEIEKEMQPIKDQINDLRNSLANFNFVNCRNNTRGINSSIICIEPTERNRKTCFTIASQIDSQNSSTDYLIDVDSMTKKLSPLAEMYVKLAQCK